MFAMLRNDGCTDTRADNVKTVYPQQTKFVGGWVGGEGGIIKHEVSCIILNIK